MEYDEFELQIGPLRGESLLLRARGRAGQAEAESFVQLPDSLWAPVTRELVHAGALRRAAPAELGDQLFRTAFAGDVRHLFHECLGGSVAHKRGLRIRLTFNLDDRSLAPLLQIPWELLYRKDVRKFLALDPCTPLVRSLAVPLPAPLLRLCAPLRILVAVAQDSGFATLNLAAEINRLREVARTNPAIEIEVLSSPTLQALREKLDSSPFNVLHFMGHGTFDRESGEGALVFQGPGQPPELISGEHLAIKIRGFKSLQLVVLNACNTAVLSGDAGHDPFAGVAAALLVGGITAVVAMQAPVADTHAIDFSTAFYQHLARGFPLDTAVTEGRQIVHSRVPGSSDWSIPVLFLRAPSGDMAADETEKLAKSRSRRIAAGLIALPLSLTLAGLALLQPWQPKERQPDPLSTRSEPEPVQSRATTVPESNSPADKPSPEPSAPPVAASQERSASVEPVQEQPARTPSLTIEGAQGVLAVEISGSPPSSFRSALRRQIEPLLRDSTAGKSLSGRTLWVEVGSPDSFATSQDGASGISCRLEAEIRLAGPGPSVDVAPAAGIRQHSSRGAACSDAAVTLAEEVVIQLMQAL